MSLTLVAGAMMLLASTAAAYQVCSATAGISACCRITKPGNYTVSGSLTGKGGACIEIAASGVTLYGGFYTLTGNLTGIGIRLLPTAKGDVVADFTSISDFQTGILDDAPGSVITEAGPVESNAGNGIVIRASRVYLSVTNSNANGGNGVLVTPLAPATVVSNVSLDNDTSYGNKGDGMKIVDSHGDVFYNDRLGSIESLNGANGIEVRNSTFQTFHGDNSSNNKGDGMLFVNDEGENVTNCTADNNGGSGMDLKRTTSSHILGGSSNANAKAGIWLDGSRGIAVEAIGSVNSGTADVYIGCSPKQEPEGTTCADVGLPASNGNRVVQGSFNYSSGTRPDVGIGIDLGNHNNQVLLNDATSNTTDAVDANTNCDSNVWMFNTFTKTYPAQPSCIQ